MQYMTENSTGTYSNNTLIYIIIIITVIIIICIFCGCTNRSNNEYMGNLGAKFNVTFRTNWGQRGTQNVINYPKPPKEEAPHTGNMFLAIHNSNYNPFTLGKNASKGVAESSMYGTNDTLIQEISNNRRNYNKYYTAPVLKTPGEYTFNVTANQKYPLMSFVTMIAPSPDWFTGVSSVNLMDIKKSKVIPVYTYDAGTDHGTKFVTFPKHPRGRNTKPISYLTSGEMFPNGLRSNIPPIGFIEIKRTY
ncbi:MAG: hypothetical protein Terrestrivirus1_77 [Terrestrivirus sp.]|uniref:Spondin domain-containing protein n=1 Tax=Terrestrivirus sp. TaxID=2487775 RepID=A0A3G4ZNL8_9VIRU|nr:MAG: hypothetical protein Terrestrivirus1_77 [Terrestrivirus sp.]